MPVRKSTVMHKGFVADRWFGHASKTSFFAALKCLRGRNRGLFWWRMKSGNPLAALLDTPEVPDLGPGPRGGVRTIKDLESAIASAGGNRPSGELLGGLVLLWHDHLDASHEIAQEIESVDGSYLHAIMHRREPDYSNAKYWFRRVGKHACYPQLAREAADILKVKGASDLLKKLAPNGDWDAFAFVDACESVAKKRSAETEALLRDIQAREFKLLFEHFSG